MLVFKTVFPVFDSSPLQCSVELQTNLREVPSCKITEKAPTRTFSWLKAPSTAFTFKTLIRPAAAVLSIKGVVEFLEM